VSVDSEAIPVITMAARSSHMSERLNEQREGAVGQEFAAALAGATGVPPHLTVKGSKVQDGAFSAGGRAEKVPVLLTARLAYTDDMKRVSLAILTGILAVGTVAGWAVSPEQREATVKTWAERDAERARECAQARGSWIAGGRIRGGGP
jgi:hypothetical protein